MFRRSCHDAGVAQPRRDSGGIGGLLLASQMVVADAAGRLAGSAVGAARVRSGVRAGAVHLYAVLKVISDNRSLALKRSVVAAQPVFVSAVPGFVRDAMGPLPSVAAQKRVAHVSKR